MKYQNIGDTGLNISQLGFGTVKFGRNTGVKYPRPFDLPDTKQMHALLDMAQAGGINLLDTAPAYGDSEEKLGRLLSERNDDWVICTKAGEEFDIGSAQSSFDFSPSAIRRSVERSLTRLKLDVLDMVLIHSDGDDVNIIEQYGALDTLSDLKREGLIRASGMSTKTIEGGVLALRHSDCVMVAFNPAYQDEKAVIDYALENNKGILVKKLLNSGHSADEPNGLQDAVAVARRTPGISSVIMGTTNLAHLEQNLELFNRAI